MPQAKRNISKKIPSKAIALILLFLLISSAILAFFTTNIFAGDKIYKGVSACGVKVGGLTLNEALETLHNASQKALGDMNIDIIYGDKRRSIDITDRIVIDYAAAAEAAYSVGREGEPLQRLAVVFGKKVDIPVNVNFDEKYIKSKIESFAEETEQENSVYKISDDKKSVSVNLTGSGIIVDVKGTYDLLVDNGSKMKFDDVNAVIQTEFNESTVDLLYNRIKREPINATCTIIDNKPVIEKHQMGIDVDKTEIADNIKQGKKVFVLKATEIMPSITAEKLEASMFKDVLGEYSTKYSASNAGRTTNMSIAAAKINGIVIPAGENFSFNKIVGERTYAKGYRDANVYVGGRIEQGVGGGICQVASTLYSAQLYADLQTVTRLNHQFTVSYLPLGQDATVSWNSVDYVFKNNTDYPIKILATVANGVHSIKILGTKVDKDKRVKIETKTISVKEPQEKVTLSANLAPGKTVVSQQGQSGAVVDTYKVYLRNGVEESRVFLHRSTYNAMDRIVTKSSNTAPVHEPANNDETNSDATGITVDETDAPQASTQPSAATPGASPSQAPIPSENLSDNGI